MTIPAVAFQLVSFDELEFCRFRCTARFRAARLGSGYPLVSSAPAFLCFCAPSGLKIPTFGRQADDRRLPGATHEVRESRLFWPRVLTLRPGQGNFTLSIVTKGEKKKGEKLAGPRLGYASGPSWPPQGALRARRWRGPLAAPPGAVGPRQARQRCTAATCKLIIWGACQWRALSAAPERRLRPRFLVSDTAVATGARKRTALFFLELYDLSNSASSYWPLGRWIPPRRSRVI